MLDEIMSISRLRMGTDGKGVSTLVAFFDCPLKCKYCINEGCHRTKQQLEVVKYPQFAPNEVIDILKKDEIYYLMSGGGMVFGGGEPLLHSKFIHKICTQADSRWARRIETSLNVPWDYIKPVLYDMDEWIIDIKDINDDIYKKYTGISNQNMLKNLLRLGNRISTEKIHIRVPRISGYNCTYDVEKSVEWIRENMAIEPEVFEYKKI